MDHCTAIECKNFVPRSSTRAQFCDNDCCVAYTCHHCGYGSIDDDLFCGVCIDRYGDWLYDPDFGLTKAQRDDGRERRNRILSKDPVRYMPVSMHPQDERQPSDRNQSLGSSRQGRSSSYRRSRSRTRSPGSRTRNGSSEYTRDCDRSYSHGSHSRRTRSRSPGSSRPTRTSSSDSQRHSRSRSRSHSPSRSRSPSMSRRDSPAYSQSASRSGSSQGSPNTQGSTNSRGSAHEERIAAHEVVEFYTRENKSLHFKGNTEYLTRIELMRKNNTWLRECHDWIQILAPGTGASNYVATSPVLSPDEIMQIPRSLIADTMARLEGYFAYVAGASLWHTHENFRVTRIIKFLRLRGCMDEASSFHRRILDLREPKTEDAHGYWRHALWGS